MKQLNEAIEMVRELVGKDYLYFDKAVTARPTEISFPFYAWAVCVGPDQVLYVMDNDEQWFPVKENQTSIRLINALHARIYIMYIKYFGKEAASKYSLQNEVVK